MHPLITIGSACAIYVLLGILIMTLKDRKPKNAKTKHDLLELVTRMTREWNTYSDEKKRACALWMTRVGIKVPARMIPSR